jgi:hypothetical protein
MSFLWKIFYQLWHLKKQYDGGIGELQRLAKVLCQNECRVVHRAMGDP